MLQCLRIVPNELAMTPLPTPLITPPVTKMYFITYYNVEKLLVCVREYRCRVHAHQTIRHRNIDVTSLSEATLTKLLYTVAVQTSDITVPRASSHKTFRIDENSSKISNPNHIMADSDNAQRAIRSVLCDCTKLHCLHLL